MIRTVEIPVERWSSFVQMLGRMAAGRPVRLEVARREIGDQELGDKVPLRDMRVESKGSERGDLIIIVGSDGEELTHLIERPKRMAVGLGETGEPQWLAVEEQDEGTTIVFFEELPVLEEEYGATP